VVRIEQRDHPHPGGGVGDDLATLVVAWLVLPLAAVVGVAGGLVWASGQLGAVVSGGGWPDVPVTQGPGIAIRLARDPGHPGTAWPPGARPDLGPVWVFYPVLALLVAMLVGVLVLGAWWWRTRTRPDTGREGARWASRREEATITVPDHPGERHGRLVAGRSHRSGRLLAGGDCVSAVGFGPNGSGKTTGLIAPNVAEWDGPVLLTTTKIPDLALIHARRAALGPVWVLAPGGAPGYQTAGWSPVDYATCPEAADRVADWLVEASGLSVDPKSRPWLVQARKYVKPLLLASYLSRGGIDAFLSWVYAGRDATDDIRHILHTHQQPEVFAEYTSTWSIHEEGIGSVLFTAYGIADAYTRATARRAAQQSPRFTVPDLFAHPAATLVMLAPEAEVDRHAPVFTAVIAAVIHHAEQLAAQQGGPLSPRLLLALDEAGTIFRYPRIANLLTTARGNGIQLLAVYHDLAQLEQLFGRPVARTVVSNAKLRILLPGQGDLDTLRHFTALLGQARVARASTTRGHGGHRSTSVAAHTEDLAPLHTLRELPPGQAVIQYQHLPATRVRLRFTHHDKQLRALLAAATNRTGPTAGTATGTGAGETS
jgi:type IV secretory pathway TraG/TraD family ATPase VirD4